MSITLFGLIMPRVKKVGLVFALAWLLALPVKAAELWMFEETGCAWCQRWHAEIGVIYAKTDEGKAAPLRQFNLHLDDLPANVDLTKKPYYTPTFVLIDNGREVGRIEGYPGEDFFWGLLGQLIAKLDNEKEPAS